MRDPFQLSPHWIIMSFQEKTGHQVGIREEKSYLFPGIVIGEKLLWHTVYTRKISWLSASLWSMEICQHLSLISSRPPNYSRKKNNSYYGTIDSDFRNSLLYLCIEHNLIKDFPSTDEDYQVFDTIQLKEIVLPILTKHYIYFTDSDATWVPFAKGSKRLKNYDEMLHFFSSGVEKTQDEVCTFLEKSSWSPSIMADCLAYGRYSETTWNSDIDWDQLENALKF